MAAQRVLITGASVAGPTLAIWLDRAGYDVTVVERAAELRLGGQNVDIRGPGREVVRRMGLEDTLLANGTTEEGTRFVDEAGKTIAAFPAGTDDSSGATAEMEILRGELARILVESAGPTTTYRYGDSVAGVTQDAAGVDVAFASGATECFDLVFFADGIRSSSRELVFPGEADIRDLGLYTAYGTIPRTDTDDSWWRWMNADGARVVGLRPDNLGTTRFSLSWMSDSRGYESADPQDLAQALRATFAGVGGEAPRILNALGAGSELYVDYLSQIHAPRWSDGRIALVGDAAWCATPLSGMGTTLSVTGAYVLAGELARASDHRAAFAQYDAVMRPLVDRAQKLPPGTPKVAHPSSRVGVAVMRNILRLAGSGPARALASKFASPDTETTALPDYCELDA